MQIMFINISWTNYLAIVAFLLIGYYLIVGIKFYSSELRLYFSGKRNTDTRLSSDQSRLDNNHEVNRHFQQNEPESFASYERFAPTVEEADNTSNQVEELSALLKEAIAKAASKSFIKQEFIVSLQLILKKYHFLKHSPFLGVINDMISLECEKYGYILLSAEEQVMLWNE